MRRPPPMSRLPAFPVTAVMFVAAVSTTLAWWMDVDVSLLMMDPDIHRGELWRLFTSTLLHANLLHLAFNLYWLWVFGSALEGHYGPVRTALVYLALGVGSSAAEWALAEGGVGLSGIGYGLFGLMWMLSRRHPRFSDAVDRPTVQLFVGWFILCIVLTEAGMWNVANVAHGSGAVFGLLLGAAITAPRVRRGAFAAAFALALALSIVGATVGRAEVNIFGGAGDDFRWLAYDALTGEDFEESVKWGRRAVRADPRNAGGWTNLAIAHLALENPNEALAVAETGAALNPDDAKLADLLRSIRLERLQAAVTAGDEETAAKLLKDMDASEPAADEPLALPEGESDPIPR